jgi:hypothetical protein
LSSALTSKISRTICGAQSDRRLIEQQEAGAQHQGSADGEHLLLAAGEQARGQMSADLQTRKE